MRVRPTPQIYPPMPLGLAGYRQLPKSGHVAFRRHGFCAPDMHEAWVPSEAIGSMWRHNTQAAGRLVLACQPVSVPIGRQGAHLLASCPWHPGPRRRAPLPLSRGVPSDSRAPPGPTRTGTEIALPVDRPGGKVMLKSTITEPPRSSGSSGVSAHAGA